MICNLSDSLIVPCHSRQPKEPQNNTEGDFATALLLVTSNIVVLTSCDADPATPFQGSEKTVAQARTGTHHESMTDVKNNNNGNKASRKVCSSAAWPKILSLPISAQTRLARFAGWPPRSSNDAIWRWSLTREHCSGSPLLSCARLVLFDHPRCYAMSDRSVYLRLRKSRIRTNKTENSADATGQRYHPPSCYSHQPQCKTTAKVRRALSNRFVSRNLPSDIFPYTD